MGMGDGSRSVHRVMSHHASSKEAIVRFRCGHLHDQSDLLQYSVRAGKVCGGHH